MLQFDVFVVGAGLSGATIAERFATVLNKNVLIIDKCNHIAGNCFDFFDYHTLAFNNKPLQLLLKMTLLN